MNRTIIAAVAAISIGAAGCSPVGLGTGIGAGLGAIVAAALGGGVQAIAIGTILGGAGGFIVASAVEAANQPPGVCQAVAANGMLIYVTPGGAYTTTPTPYPLLVTC